MPFRASVPLITKPYRPKHDHPFVKARIAASAQALQPLMLRLIGLFERHSGLMAILAFASGVASFLLVDRRESLAQFIGVLMLVSWIWLVAENWLRAGVLRRFGFAMPPAAMRFATQLVHQESLFFTLPFFIATTSWNHGQAGFTGLLMLCALISLIDPLYYKQLAPRRALFVVFHALCLFAVLLVVLPLVLHLNTEQSLALALLMALLLSLPSLRSFLPNGRWWRLPLLVLMLAALAASLWQARSWVPPAALRLTDIKVSPEMDREQRTPGASINRINSAKLQEHGLYAWSSVRAPRGLREQIFHVWVHNGVIRDRIALDLLGGRDGGYRAWSHKLNFPPHPAGRWQVRVVTESGQLIGIVRFTVTDEELRVVDWGAPLEAPPAPETVPVETRQQDPEALEPNSEERETTGSPLNALPETDTSPNTSEAIDP